MTGQQAPAKMSRMPLGTSPSTLASEARRQPYSAAMGKAVRAETPPSIRTNGMGAGRAAMISPTKSESSNGAKKGGDDPGQSTSKGRDPLTAQRDDDGDDQDISPSHMGASTTRPMVKAQSAGDKDAQTEKSADSPGAEGYSLWNFKWRGLSALRGSLSGFPSLPGSSGDAKSPGRETCSPFGQEHGGTTHEENDGNTRRLSRSDVDEDASSTDRRRSMGDGSASGGARHHHHHRFGLGGLGHQRSVSAASQQQGRE